MDLVRGLVMVLMALDHTRDFFGDLSVDPHDIRTASPALFFTRWVTHFCAPVFVFLAGTSAWLSASKGKSKAELSRFLLVRGLWLVVLEYTAVTFGWLLTWSFGAVFHQVIAVIGLSMIVLAGLLWLPRWAVLAFGLVLVGGHNLLDGLEFGEPNAPSALWTFLHLGALRPVGLPLGSSGYWMLVIYPLIPWAGVLALGYAAGPLFQRARPERRRLLAGIGLALTLLFVGLRFLDAYGDPISHAEQLARWAEAHPAETPGLVAHAVAFVNVAKYPPSLLYLAMTLGPAFLLLRRRWIASRAERGRRS